MVGSWASKALVPLMLLWGCERGENASSPPPVSPAPDRAAVAAAAPLSEDMKEALRVRAALDEGDVRKALVGARRLMASAERDVRSEVLTVLAWIGRRAMPELAKMMRDPDGDLAQEALTGWEQAFDELHYDFERSREMLAAVSNLTETAMIDAVMMKTSELEPESSLPLLERVILECKGLPASVCAKDMFRHLAGESWSSTNRTRRLVRQLTSK